MPSQDPRVRLMGQMLHRVKGCAVVLCVAKMVRRVLGLAMVEGVQDRPSRLLSDFAEWSYKHCKG